MNERLVILAGGISSRMKKSLAAASEMDTRLTEDAAQKTKSMIGVGKDERPFLDYLLYNARETGFTDVVIVVGEHDSSIQSHYGEKERDNDYKGLNISYAVQKIPSGRAKPLGTADALMQALHARPDWAGHWFVVCNSDNLYSRKALTLMAQSAHPNALVDYDRAALQFPQERIEKFAVTKKDEVGFLLEIVEKPTPEDIESIRGADGAIGVSMNIFRLDYDMALPYMENAPLHPVRQEKELPGAVVTMAQDHPKTCFAYPVKEHILDLTQITDVAGVQEALDAEYGDFSF